MSTRVPVLALLEPLHKRNEFLVRSHHPLLERLFKQTGVLESNRAAFPNSVFNEARAHPILRTVP